MSEKSSEPETRSREKDDLPQSGPLGDVLPGKGPDPRTRGGRPQEKVEDRPVVGTVKPEDYPRQQ